MPLPLVMTWVLRLVWLALPVVLCTMVPEKICVYESRAVAEKLPLLWLMTVPKAKLSPP
jgi:hypothetical protein